MSDYGHTEPKRGAEWWGKSHLLTLGWAGIPAFSKVSRCKSGTLSGRYRRNGYVLGLIQHPGRLSGRHRGQAPSHIWNAVHQLDSCNLPDSKLAPHSKLCRYLWLSQASQLPHLILRIILES
ncbi:hypothetical protein PspR76_17165 [Pseudomonas sp. R76]|nr:hypothetical protein PspR76_17165 [Pseudomonas sp. R76]